MPICGPGPTVLVEGNIGAKRLSFTTDLAIAAAWADPVFIPVDTRSRRGDQHAGLPYVFAAPEVIGWAPC